jgi:hypothetical protein
MNDLIEDLVIGDGYEEESPQIGWLRDLLMQMNEEDFSKFLKFVTGIARLPYNQMKNIEPRLTITRSTSPDPPDSAFPCALTCQHVFVMPAYSSAEIMEAKVMRAISEVRYFGLL